MAYHNLPAITLAFVVAMLMLWQQPIMAQDPTENYSTIAPSCESSAHLLDLFCIFGTPQNRNSNDSVIILVNHGYAIGYSPKRKQPLWAAYQVSKADKPSDYARPLFFVDDNRLPDSCQIGNDTYGSGYDLGHMAPNESINRSYGKLSQMETFLMSNIAPQSAGLNQGVWAKLETAIREDYCDAKGRDTTENGKSKTKMEHVWVVVGPIFSSNPQYLTRDNGMKVEIPEAFFCILVRPYRYSYAVPGNSQYISFVFPQNLSKSQKLDTKFIATINEIEDRTGLNFFPFLTKYYENKFENLKAEELW